MSIWRSIVAVMAFLLLTLNGAEAQPKKLTYLDVKALTQKAADLLASQGLEAAEKAFLQDGEFKFAEIYINVIDLQGNWVIYPPKPENKGRSILSFTDEDGVHLGEDILRVGKSGQGWTEYRWRNPSTGNVQPKLTFVIRVPNQDYIVYAGLYK